MKQDYFIVRLDADADSTIPLLIRGQSPSYPYRRWLAILRKRVSSPIHKIMGHAINSEGTWKNLPGLYAEKKISCWNTGLS